MKIEKGYTKMIVPYEKGKAVFAHPAFKGNYGKVAEQIDNAGFKRPTSEETASLVYDALQNPKGEYEAGILKIMKDNWLWEFTGNLYLPKSNEEVNNGVILDTNPTIQNGKLVMDKSSLIKRLDKNDSSVKFVPFGYKTGEQNILDLSKNDYIIARYGEEGAEKIAKIASEYKNKPVLWSFDSVDEEKVRVSALGDGGGFGGRLLVNGYGWGGDDDGHAFGVERKA